MQKIILTGDRPTGPLHLGHYVGSLKSRVELQENHLQYIMIADVQALTDNFENTSKVRNNIYEVFKDYLSVGIDALKSTIFIQSGIPEIAELTLYFLNLVTVGRLERNPTVKSEIQQKSFGDSIPAGFLCYPVNQAADITIFSADIVPVGEDQLPMLEQTNEIVRKFSRIYNTNCLKEVTSVLGKTPRLLGIDGKAKAGKSLGNAIFLSDTQEEVKSKVFQMFTDPNHIKISDPGKIEGNVVFAYLDAFFDNKEELDDLKNHYQKGGLGDSTIKGILNDTLEKILSPIRDRRNIFPQKELVELLHEGTKRAKKIASLKISEVREVMGINY
jgi:tryptophanyl-tRNA synthetase